MNICTFLYDNDIVIEAVYKIVMLLIVAWGLYSILFQKKGLQYTTTRDCIEKHRKILIQQQRLRMRKQVGNISGNAAFGARLAAKHEIELRNHLGLVAEELFYMEKKYLPNKTAKSWLRHMIEFIPVRNKKGVIINEQEIRKSREVKSFIELNSHGNYETYIDLTKDGALAFRKINRVFTVYGAAFQKLEGKELLVDNVKETLAKEIWENVQCERDAWHWRLMAFLQRKKKKKA